MLRISVRNYHPPVFKVRLTHMLATEVTEESDRLSPLQVTTSVRPRSSLHHNNRGSARHTASLWLSLVSLFQFCGRLVDDGQLKQSPHPTPACCHIKPDLHRLTPGPLRAYVVVLANGKERICRRERGTNSWCRRAEKERAERREGRKEKSLKEWWHKAEIWTPAKLL